MMVEPWADAQLSSQLVQLCAAGESQTLEFKRELPKHVGGLAKAVAALASSSGGLILIGVTNDGSICGLLGALDAGKRDEVTQRVVGICAKVRPPILPDLKWASANGQAVLCIAVPKGTEPIYYAEDKPYIRHGTVSRPAKPEEVLAAAATNAAPAKSSEAGAVNAQLTRLAAILANILGWCDTDAELRDLSPWVEEWTAQAESHAYALRALAATDWAVKGGHVDRLEDLADRLDEVVGFAHVLGGGSSFAEVCSHVREAAASLMETLVWPAAISEENQQDVQDAIVDHSRRLSSLWTRAGRNVFDGRVEKAQEDSSSIGRTIAEWSYFRLTIVPEESLSELRRIGLALVSLAGDTVYMDGGASLTNIAQRGKALSDALARVTATYSQSDPVGVDQE